MHRELKNQSSVFEQRINQLTDENELLRKNFREASDVNRKLPEYENKIALLSKEIERLNDVLLKYNREIVPSLEDKLKNSNLEIDEYRRRLSEMGELSKNNQEIMGRLKVVSQENEQYMRRIQEYEFRMSQITGEI